MRNSSSNLHVALFSCRVKLFYFSVLLLLFFVSTFMANKDEYKACPHIAVFFQFHLEERCDMDVQTRR